MLALAIGLPPSSHFIYIPVVLILGIVLGWVLGSKATRDELALQARKAAERESLRAARQARDAARDAAAKSTTSSG
jgi:hypothetical protein